MKSLRCALMAPDFSKSEKSLLSPICQPSFSTNALSMIRACIMACFLGSFVPSQVRAETVDNGTIVLLTKAGLSEGLIIDKINSLPCGYDVSTSQLILLKQQAVHENVIASMVRRCATLSEQRGLSGDSESSDPAVKHAPGIYIMESWATPIKLLALRPTKPSGVRTTGNGSILFPLNYRMTFPGITSQLSAGTLTPIFYFYFDESDNQVSDFGSEKSSAAQSPDEFNLVQLQIKNDNREVSIGRASAYGAAAMSIRKGIDPKLALRFTTEPLGHGIFKVSCDRDLQPGEYAFVFTSSDTKSRVYPFSIARLTNNATIHQMEK